MLLRPSFRELYSCLSLAMPSMHLKAQKITLMEYFRRKKILARLIKINDKFIKERKHEEKS